MRDHLRGWLLASGYCVLPGYCATRFTYFGYLFPHFLTTTSALVAGFVYGGFIYVTYLIFRYVSSIGFGDHTVLRHFMIRIGWWLALLGQIFILPLPLVWSPLSILWNKAVVFDLRRTSPAMVAKAEMANKKRLPPRIYAIIYGKPTAVRSFSPTPTAQRYDPMDDVERDFQPTIVVREPDERQIIQSQPRVAPSPFNPKILSAVGKSGAVLDGRFHSWGKQTDGSVLAPTADQAGIIVTRADGGTIILSLKIE